MDGTYCPIELHETSDGIIWGHSPTLGLDLCWVNERLQFYDPAKGEYHRDLREAEAVLMEMQDELTRAEQRLNNEREARRAAEQAANAQREAAEERERRLLEQIRRLSESCEPSEGYP